MKLLITIGVLLFTAVLHAEPRTFTDAFGRTITAEIISVDGDQVRIRREDGQLFTLKPSQLTEEDQQFIQQWSANKSGASSTTAADKITLDPKKFILALSRGKFDTRIIAKYDTYVHKHENWGYSIQLTNQHLRPVSNLRVEYNLFARTFADTSSPTLITGAKDVTVIASRAMEVFRTKTAEVCKSRDASWGYNSSGEMRGIWVRIYADGQLLIEQSTPESLMTTETWTKIKNEE